MGNLSGVQRRIEIIRYYVDVELTEDGVYKEGQVPDAYSGGFIAVLQVCYAIVSSDATGKILLTTYNPPDVKDKEDKVGMQIVDDKGKELRPVSVDPDASAEILTLSIQENTNLPENFKTHADNMWEVAKRELGEWYV